MHHGDSCCSCHLMIDERGWDWKQYLDPIQDNWFVNFRVFLMDGKEWEGVNIIPFSEKRI